MIISQIVTDLSWFWLDDVSRLRLVNAFEKAEKCYFVSQNNLKLHNFLLTYEALNSELIYNPFKRDGSSAKFDYPINRFQVAIVGRLECYHKGLDILIRIITEKKWQDREVNFNFYGSGPHAQMIENLFKKLGIKNAFLKGFSSDIIDLWKNNHILLQPSRMEGQSLALLEATNLGRAAIATNVGGVAEIITDNVTGFIAETATIRDLDDAMERAWERRGEWESIGVAAYDKFREVYPADPVSFFNTKIVSLLDAPTS